MTHKLIANSSTNADIKNIVVIRFSLRMCQDWQKKAYGDESNRGRWFDYRMMLFNKFLAKSLRIQKVKSHINFVLMDETDQENYRNYEACLSDIVTPIFSKNNNHFSQVSDEIKRRGFESIAISRIDSDDAVADDYFFELNKTIKNCLRNSLEFTYVVATRGYRAGSQSWQEIFYNCSPFLTRYVPYFADENIYDINHEHAIQYQHIQCSTARWIQVIHDTNIANGFINSQHEEKFFLENINLNPKLIATKQLAYTDKLTPLIFAPYIDSLKFQRSAE